MPPLADAAALKNLETLVQTAGTLVKQLQDVLTEIQQNPEAISPATAPTPTSSTSTTSLDALSLARDSASLVKAHATKISLLIINEPFTPSAISTVVRELIAGPIPALAACVQACDPSLYTVVFRRELAWVCHLMLSDIYALLEKIPKDGKILSGFNKESGRGSLALTGTLWLRCDSLVKLANTSVGGLFARKVEGWRETLKDVMEEMKEWGEEEPNEDENENEEDDDASSQNGEADDLADQNGSNHVATQNMLDNLMSWHQPIPHSDPDQIRPRLETSLKRLRLVILLYQAISKRRIRKLPSFPITTTTTTTTSGTGTAASNIPQRLDEIADVLHSLPYRFEDLACAFYDLRPEEIDNAMDLCFLDAFAASELLSATWDGGQDEFTEWTKKFQAEIKKD